MDNQDKLVVLALVCILFGVGGLIFNGWQREVTMRAKCEALHGVFIPRANVCVKREAIIEVQP